MNFLEGLWGKKHKETMKTGGKTMKNQHLDDHGDPSHFCLSTSNSSEFSGNCFFQVIMDLDLDDKAATLISASFDGFVKAASSVEMAMVETKMGGLR